MSDAGPSDRKQKGETLLNDVDKIAPVLLASGAKREELSTRSPDAVTALRTLGMGNLKHCTEIGGSEVDPVSEMMVLEQFAYRDLANAAGVASLGTFLPQCALEKALTGGNVPTAAISFFPARPAPACLRPFVTRPQRRRPSRRDERHSVGKSWENSSGVCRPIRCHDPIQIHAESAAHQL